MTRSLSSSDAKSWSTASQESSDDSCQVAYTSSSERDAAAGRIIVRSESVAVAVALDGVARNIDCEVVADFGIADDNSLIAASTTTSLFAVAGGSVMLVATNIWPAPKLLPAPLAAPARTVARAVHR